MPQKKPFKSRFPQEIKVPCIERISGASCEHWVQLPLINGSQLSFVVWKAQVTESPERLQQGSRAPEGLTGIIMPLNYSDHNTEVYPSTTLAVKENLLFHSWTLVTFTENWVAIPEIPILKGRRKGKGDIGGIAGFWKENKLFFPTVIHLPPALRSSPLAFYNVFNSFLKSVTVETKLLQPHNSLNSSLSGSCCWFSAGPLFGSRTHPRVCAVAPFMHLIKLNHSRCCCVWWGVESKDWRAERRAGI